MVSFLHSYQNTKKIDKALQIIFFTYRLHCTLHPPSNLTWSFSWYYRQQMSSSHYMHIAHIGGEGGGGISTDRGFDSWRIIWDTPNNTSCTLYSADQLILTSATARSSTEVARHRSSWNISHCLLFILNEELALSVTWCTPNPNSKYSYGK